MSLPSLEFALQKAFELARNAVTRGNHPFGAVLVRDGVIVLEAENSVVTDHDVTKHAELNLVSEASKRFNRDELAMMTLVSSTEPCAMCGGAIYWAGIGSVIYGCSAQTLESIAHGGWANSLSALYKGVDAAPRVSGPHQEEEAARTHREFW